MRLGTWEDLFGPDDPRPITTPHEEEGDDDASMALTEQEEDALLGSGNSGSGAHQSKSSQNVFLQNPERFWRINAGRGTLGGVIAIATMVVLLGVGTLAITPGR